MERRHFLRRGCTALGLAASGSASAAPDAGAFFKAGLLPKKVDTADVAIWQPGR